MIERVEVEFISAKQANTDIENTIIDLDKEIDENANKADQMDYLIAISSGVLCGMLDILWVGEFNIKKSRTIADEKVKILVEKTAERLGCKEKGIKSAVAFLEKGFPIPSDGNTPDFGGGLQHHLRDFSHHPTIVGLVFSLITQFTGKSYGTDIHGNFIIVPVSEKSKVFIGKDVSDKLIKGTVIWFFHLVSDIAGSSSTAGLSGGTGIPGPILSLAKEIASLPLIKQIQIQDKSLSVFISKMFNGTLFAQYDAEGRIIKESVVRFDFRTEIGVGTEIGRQAIPVIANECIVRTFYLVRRIYNEIKNTTSNSAKKFSEINWEKVKPCNNPTMTRMLTISTGVFSTLDVVDAVISQKYWVEVNYAGLGRFSIALSGECINYLKVRNVKMIKAMYEEIDRNTYKKTDENIYERLSENMDVDRLGLTLDQTEILYNLEMHKTMHDIHATVDPSGKKKSISLKNCWLEEWKSYMESGFSSFVQAENAKLHWYSEEELIVRIRENEPEKQWLRLALLEAMLFEPYYPLSIEQDKKGNEKPSKKYDELKNPISGYKKQEGDKYLQLSWANMFCSRDIIKRFRKCYSTVLREMNETVKTAFTSLVIASAITIIVVITGGALAPQIAVALVGSNFAGLSGAALTSACLAYIGGGAVAIGGLGMAGGTATIVGGGAILGLGIGSGIGGVVGMVGMMGKKNTILQSAKLMVSVREIFLNDEHDLNYSNSIFEQYVKNISDIEKGLVELRLKADLVSKEEQKELKFEIKNAEESVKAMKIAMKSMNKFKSSFEIGEKS